MTDMVRRAGKRKAQAMVRVLFKPLYLISRVLDNSQPLGNI